MSPRPELPLSIQDLQTEMNRMIQRLWHAGSRVNPFSENDWVPDADIRVDARRVVVSLEIPGVDIADVELSFVDGALVVSGNKKPPSPETGRPLLGERGYGRFSRTLPIAVEVDPSQIAASCRQGVLEIILPKIAAAAGRNIPIRAEDEKG